jgi:hypothetical protein
MSLSVHHPLPLQAGDCHGGKQFLQTLNFNYSTTSTDDQPLILNHESKAFRSMMRIPGLNLLNSQSSAVGIDGLNSSVFGQNPLPFPPSHDDQRVSFAVNPEESPVTPVTSCAEIPTSNVEEETTLEEMGTWEQEPVQQRELNGESLPVTLDALDIALGEVSERSSGGSGNEDSDDSDR